MAAAATAVLMAACGGQTPAPAPGVAWHRYPVGVASRVEPAIAVIYSSDNIGPTASLARLGYPDRNLFRLHRDHPQLKVVLTSCPANRYSGGRVLSDSPEATATWKTLALDPNFDWIDLAGLGYNHAPPGDSNLNHHEFSVTQSGCNIDHKTLGEATYCSRQMTLARDAYRTAGIPDDRVVMMRFPGMERSTQALAAAAAAGFIAVLDTPAGGEPRGEPGREWWTPLPGGGEILEIPNTNVLKLFAIAKELEDGLIAGRILPAQVTASPEFAAALKRGLARLREVEAGGGLVNLMDQWSDTFREVGGARPRYLLIDAALRDIESRYGPRAWYPTSRELTLWLDLLRNGRLTRQDEGGGTLVKVEPPAGWARLGLGGLDNASIRVSLAGAGASRAVDLKDVLIKEGERDWRSLEPERWWRQADDAVVLFALRGPVQLRLKLS
ncbi:MAG TPA: hypothetical protein VFE84_07960 [Patescibacteria group bacterium]|nr:hypothetical protein [Patescibacteria group bacterium]